MLQTHKVLVGIPALQVFWMRDAAMKIVEKWQPERIFSLGSVELTVGVPILMWEGRMPRIGVKVLYSVETALLNLFIDIDESGVREQIPDALEAPAPSIVTLLRRHA